MRSDSVPMTGNQKKLEAPMQNVTARLDVADSFRTLLPKVGV